MADTVGLDLVLQCRRDVFLSENIVEGLPSPLVVQSLRDHSPSDLADETVNPPA